MAKKTHEDKQADVLAAMPPNAAPITHNALVAALVAAGNSDSTNAIFTLNQAKRIIPEVVANDDGTVVLSYRTPAPVVAPAPATPTQQAAPQPVAKTT